MRGPSRNTSRLSLVDALHRSLGVYSVGTGLILALALGLGTGIVIFLTQASHNTAILSALQNDVTELAKGSDDHEIERVLGSFLDSMPSARIYYVRENVIKVSVPDMELALTAFNDPVTYRFLGKSIGRDGFLYTSVELSDPSSHRNFGRLVLSVPARGLLMSSALTMVLSFLLVVMLMLLWRRMIRRVLERELLPLNALRSEIEAVGHGVEPQSNPESFRIRELSEISTVIRKQHGDIQRLTEVTVSAEGDRRAKAAVDSLLHDILNPYTALSGLIQARVMFPADEEIKAEFESEWPTLNLQIKSLFKAARHLEIEKLSPRSEDLRATTFAGATLGAVKNPAAVKVDALEKWQEASAFQVRHDPELISRAVANLVRNSVEEGASEVEVWCEARPLSIHVRDNGPGIPSEKVPALFEGRLKSSKADGSGIGFPTALRLIRLHNGRVVLEKMDRPGTHFRIDLSAMESAV